MTDLTLIDPVDALEALIYEAASNSQRALKWVQAELNRVGRDATQTALSALADEDDADERARIIDTLLFAEERMIEARRRFVEHLVACAHARGLIDDEGTPACSGEGGCGRFAPIAARVRDMDGTLVAICEDCEREATAG